MNEYYSITDDGLADRKIIEDIRQYVYDDREWTTGDYSEDVNQHLRLTQEQLKFYFEEWELRKKATDKRFNKFLLEMKRKYPDD